MGSASEANSGTRELSLTTKSHFTATYAPKKSRIIETHFAFASWVTCKTSGDSNPIFMIRDVKYHALAVRLYRQLYGLRSEGLCQPENENLPLDAVESVVMQEHVGELSYEKVALIAAQVQAILAQGKPGEFQYAQTTKIREILVREPSFNRNRAVQRPAGSIAPGLKSRGGSCSTN